MFILTGSLFLLLFGCLFSPNYSLSFLIWIAADNNLESHVEKDLGEAEGNLSWINVFAMVDYASSTDTLYRIEDIVVPLKTFNEINSGDPEALKQFLLEYSLPYTFLVIWNHGFWWRGESVSKTSSKGIAYDETDGDFLTINEIKDVLKSHPVTVLGFDACIMGTFEILWELKNVAKYIIASSEEIPVDGWDYAPLRYSSSVRDLMRKLVEAYKETYGTNVSLSVWDTSKLEDVMYWLNKIADYMIENDISPWSFEFKRRSIGGKEIELVELDSFAESFVNSTDSTLSSYGTNLYNAIFSARVYGTPEDSFDLLIYFPLDSSNFDYWEDFSALSDFIRDSAWDDLLEHWRGRN
ncbi:clostripain-related cysteine peptidase [Thermotoga sp. KOL6]|uniref:clostripain-related cysteine peptidase n=1 Tax=Thermotoga sp. KOL6 TaxID=126741 RepID=UPI000C75737E|nr:clostripain-related cysteine peptidase [Thermotoga sp. KOL6]PLV59235.1 peptidase C11 [Thermotoga sp. KOL6]